MLKKPIYFRNLQYSPDFLGALEQFKLKNFIILSLFYNFIVLPRIFLIRRLLVEFAEYCDSVLTVKVKRLYIRLISQLVNLRTGVIQ